MTSKFPTAARLAGSISDMFFITAWKPRFLASFTARAARVSELPDSVPYKTVSFPAETTAGAAAPAGPMPAKNPLSHARCAASVAESNDSKD